MMAIGFTALAVSIRLRLSDAALRAWRNRILLLGVTCTLAVLAAEAATRFVFRDVTISADNSSFFSRRWKSAVNEHGVRERSFSLQKEANTYRVAVIGDSLTFGNGLPAEERYSDLINKWLPDRFEALNFGIPGNNTPHHLETLRSRVLPAHPDFVLLQWFINDIEGDDLARRTRQATLAPDPAMHRWWNRYSALYVIANMRWAEMQMALGWSPSYTDWLKATAGDPASAEARRDAGQLREIIDTARRHNIGIGIVLFPETGFPLDATYPFEFLHERVLAICQEKGIRCLDLRPDFAKVQDRRSLWVSRLDQHPSARANETAAVKILEAFQRDWVK